MYMYVYVYMYMYMYMSRDRWLYMHIWIYTYTRVDLCIPCTELVANCMPEEEVQLQRNPPPTHPIHPTPTTPPQPPQRTPQASASQRSRTPVLRNPAATPQLSMGFLSHESCRCERW